MVESFFEGPSYFLSPAGTLFGDRGQMEMEGLQRSLSDGCRISTRGKELARRSKSEQEPTKEEGEVELARIKRKTTKNYKLHVWQHHHHQ